MDEESLIKQIQNYSLKNEPEEMESKEKRSKAKIEGNEESSKDQFENKPSSF